MVIEEYDGRLNFPNQNFMRVTKHAPQNTRKTRVPGILDVTEPETRRRRAQFVDGEKLRRQEP